MTSLSDYFDQAGLSELKLNPQEQTIYQELCERYQGTFNAACEHNQDKPSFHMLLGTLTQAHIQLSSQLEHHLQSLLKMQQAINEGIGEEHADKFKNTATVELLILTKLWVLVQGYLKMDFSLANDHALNSAKLVNNVLGADPDILRTGIMQAFYIGQKASPIPDKAPNLLDKLKSWLS